MGRLMEMLRRPIAGVPAWGWALVIAGTIAAYAWIQRLREGDGPKVVPDGGYALDDAGATDAGDIPGTPSVPDRDIPVSTNPSWVRVVTDKLVAAGAYSPIEVGNALNKVLGGLEVTAQEAAIWNEAVRRFGAPPEGHPPVVVKPTTPPPTSPPTSAALPAPGGLRVVSVTSTGVTLAWNAVSGAKSYRVFMSDGSGPTPGSVSTDTTSRQFRWTGLRPNAQHYFSVATVNSAGVRGATTRTITVRTKK